MEGKMETGDVGIWQNRALKITFLYQISSELRVTFFPNLWKNAAIVLNSTGTGTSPQKVKKSLVIDVFYVQNIFLLYVLCYILCEEYVYLSYVLC